MSEPEAVGGGTVRGAPAYDGLLARLLEVVEAGVYAIDDQGLIVAVNPRAESLLGRPARELLGQDAHDLLHRDSHGHSVPRSQCAMLRDFRAGRTVLGGTGWLARGDGSALPTSLTVTPYRLEDGATGAMVVFHRRDPTAEAAEPETTRDRGTLTELERLALLAETTSGLTSTLDADQLLRRLVGIVLPRLADWVIIDLVTENDEVWRTSVVHYDGGMLVERQDLQGPLPPVPPESAMPLSRALRGAASTLATPETYAGRPDSGLAVEQHRLFKETGMHSSLVAPIRSPRDVLGALSLGRADQLAPFTPDDLPLLEDIARRAGVALDNARLYQQQRKVAETMQRHLLPRLPRLPDLAMTVRYLSAPHASQVGGDWYDVFTLDDGAIAIAVGDVVGHDLDAAAGMAQLRNMLRADAWSHQESPSEIIDRLDRTVTRIAEVAMATLVFGRLESDGPGRWRLRWSNAGHPPPLLVTEDGQARFLTDGHGVLLGTGASVPRSDAVVTLEPRSTLILYTDGLVESPGHSIDDGLGSLRRHAAALAPRPLETFCDLLLARVRPPDNEDDVALLALRVPAPRSHAGPVELE